jgi:cell division protein FtsI (penicillin-binding protein 3)
MSEPIDQVAARRVLWVGRIALGWALLIVLRLLVLQVVQHEEYLEIARNQQHRAFPTIPDRGEILDRTGHPLAVSVRTSTAVVNPQRIVNPEFFAGVVAPMLNLDPAAVTEEIRLRQRMKKNTAMVSRFYYEIKRHLSPEEVKSLQRLRPVPFDFLEIHRDARREYPNGSTAAHIVGSVDRFNAGNSGVEQKLNEELEGARGRLRALTDALRGKYFSWFEQPPREGVDLVLSVDSVIQHEAEKHLEQGVLESGAEYGSVVVMDPHSGEILALANYPNFDPREEVPATPGAKQQAMAKRRNWAVLAPFEPGSVMKMVTVAAGIDTGKFTPDSIIYCENGAFPRPGRKAITDLGRHGAIPVTTVLVKSSNIGVTKISLTLGPDVMWEYLGRFGLGQRTGLELPGETRGLFKARYCLDKDGNPSRQIDETRCWGPYTHEYVSFGHEIGATAVQLARATSVVANGGFLVYPRLIQSKTRPRPDGGREVVPVLVQKPERALKPQTALIMRRMMRQVVEEGTGRRARLEGYTAGGKTGSAEVWDGRVRRTDLNNASFIGFAPAESPSVVVVVTLGRTPRQGGAAAAPIFKNVTQAALRILRVPPDLPDSGEPLPLDQPSTEPAGDPSLGLARAKAEEPKAGAAPALLPAGLPGAQPETAEVFSPLIDGPRVPDFRGKPVRVVMSESARAGLEIEIAGRGLAREQRPEPGSILPPGQRIRVEFRP